MENERRVQQKTPAGRYALLDELRGLDLVSHDTVPCLLGSGVSV